MRLKTKPARSQDAAHNHKQCHGLVLEKNLPEHEHRQGGTSDRERGGIGFWQMFQKITAVLPEISVGTVNAEQFGQLGAGKK